LLALVAGDLRELSTHFEVDGTLKEKDAWTLKLTPSSAGLKKVFTSIRLEGAGEVREVELQERSGDRSVIHFRDLRTTPAPTRGERQRLAPWCRHPLDPAGGRHGPPPGRLLVGREGRHRRAGPAAAQRGVGRDRSGHPRPRRRSLTGGR